MWVGLHVLIASPQEASQPLILVVFGSGSGSLESDILCTPRTLFVSMVLSSPSQE